MNQVIHIFCKDTRYLWREIALFIGLATLFVWKDYVWSEVLLGIGTVFLIARVVHAEPIPGDTQFWITRPYRWQSLLGAKLLFILIVVNVPMFLARLSLLIRNGFSPSFEFVPLVWSQVLILIGICLPAAALAALTADILPFIFSTLILLMVGFLSWWPLGPHFESWSESIEWIRTTVPIAVAILAAGCVLLLQYQTRRSASIRILALAFVAAGLFGYTTMPSTLAVELQTRFSPDPAFPVRIDVEAAPRKFAIPPKPTLTQISIPLMARGIPGDLEIQTDGLVVTFEGPDHRTFKTFARPVKTASADFSADAIVFIDRSFFDAEHTRPVRLQGSLYLTAFGNAHSQTFTLSSTSVEVGHGVYCHVDNVSSQLRCCSAFRWPRLLVFATMRGVKESIWPLISYSPFPAGMALNYIEEHWASGPPPHKPEVTFTFAEPLSHFRTDFTVEHFNLDDYSSR